MKILLVAAVTLFASVSAYAFPQYASGGYRGADLMTPEEQKAHVARLMDMKTVDECNAYVAEHHAEMDRRAAAKGINLPEVKGSPCTVMRTFGRIK